MKDRISQKSFLRKLRAFCYFTFLISSFFTLFPIITVKAATYTNISVHVAYEMINNNTQYPNLLILDVREQYEYDESHLYNATLIPVNQIDSRINELMPFNATEIVVYCLSESRSSIASQNLAGNHNFTKVFNMQGGINAWIDADYPVIESNADQPIINFSFAPFVVFLFGMIFILIFYFKKQIYKD